MEKVIIIDTPIPPESQEKFAELGLTVVEAVTLTEELLQWPGWQNYNPTETLLIFPGQGALIVQSYLPITWLDQWFWLHVYAKRDWIPGRDPKVKVKQIPHQEIDEDTKVVVVVDDVVSSGTTCRLLREVNISLFPKASWHVFSWVKQRAALLDGFAFSYALREFGTPEIKIPINSLSTLLKKEKIARSFAKRNLAGAEEKFFQLLEEIRRCT